MGVRECGGKGGSVGVRECGGKGGSVGVRECGGKGGSVGVRERWLSGYSSYGRAGRGRCESRCEHYALLICDY